MDKGGGQDKIKKKMFNAEFLSFRRSRKIYIERNQSKKGEKDK